MEKHNLPPPLFTEEEENAIMIHHNALLQQTLLLVADWDEIPPFPCFGAQIENLAPTNFGKGRGKIKNKEREYRNPNSVFVDMREDTIRGFIHMSKAEFIMMYEEVK